MKFTIFIEKDGTSFDNSSENDSARKNESGKKREFFQADPSFSRKSNLNIRRVPAHSIISSSTVTLCDLYFELDSLGNHASNEQNLFLLFDSFLRDDYIPPNFIV